MNVYVFANNLCRCLLAARSIHSSNVNMRCILYFCGICICIFDADCKFATDYTIFAIKIYIIYVYRWKYYTNIERTTSPPRERLFVRGMAVGRVICVQMRPNNENVKLNKVRMRAGWWQRCYMVLQCYTFYRFHASCWPMIVLVIKAARYF